MSENEISERGVIEYKYVFNKVFTGEFLKNNLGHEVINFIEFQEGKNKQRYVYLNPEGKRAKAAEKYTKYVFHVMGIGKNKYEVIGLSEVEWNDSCHYVPIKKTDNSDLYPKLEGFSLKDLFVHGADFGTVKAYSFKTKNYYVPKEDISILFDNKKAEIDKEKKQIKLICRLQRNICYSRRINNSEEDDVHILDELIKNIDFYFEIKKNDEKIDRDNDELSYSVICDRTKLEDSMSNQIAYYLNRDQELLDIFINNFLGIKDISDEYSFDIERERGHIDILIKVIDKNGTVKKVMVIENKIDSDFSTMQLRKYIDYINKEEEFKKVSKTNQNYFVLYPKSNHYITRERIDEVGGKNYKDKTYNDLFEKIKGHNYSPLGGASNHGIEMFNEFLKSIELLTKTKAKINQDIQYIRLAQRIKGLEKEDK